MPVFAELIIHESEDNGDPWRHFQVLVRGADSMDESLRIAQFLTHDLTVGRETFIRNEPTAGDRYEMATGLREYSGYARFSVKLSAPALSEPKAEIAEPT